MNTYIEIFVDKERYTEANMMNLVSAMASVGYYIILTTKEEKSDNYKLAFTQDGTQEKD